MKDNIYYQPESFNLEYIEELSESCAEIYDFNMLIVVRHTPTNRLFFATSSGGSCPTPFEEYNFNVNDNGINTDMSEITNHNFSTFEQEVKSFPVEMAERQACLVKVKALLRST